MIACRSQRSEIGTLSTRCVLTIAAIWAAEKWRRSRRNVPLSCVVMESSCVGRYANDREGKLRFRLRQDMVKADRISARCIRRSQTGKQSAFRLRASGLRRRGHFNLHARPARPCRCNAANFSARRMHCNSFPASPCGARSPVICAACWMRATGLRLTGGSRSSSPTTADDQHVGTDQQRSQTTNARRDAVPHPAERPVTRHRRPHGNQRRLVKHPDLSDHGNQLNLP